MHLFSTTCLLLIIIQILQNFTNIKEFLHAGPTLIGILPYAGLKFYVYEELKRHVPEEHQKSIAMRLSCGAIAGVLGQTLTYPLDVVRRQMQVLHHRFSCLFSSIDKNNIDHIY